MRDNLLTILRLGVKELWSLARDPVMLFLIIFTFTASVYIQATGTPETLQRAAIAIVDEDGSPLSGLIAQAFYPPYFVPPVLITHQQEDIGLDRGTYTFVLDIPPEFQQDLLQQRNPTIQLNIDATRMSQAFTGGSYVQTFTNDEISTFLNRHTDRGFTPIDLDLRARFNQNLTQLWFASLNAVVNAVTLLSIILTGAALIRENEQGTIEHLLVMPVTAFQIMVSKILSMGGVVLAATAVSITAVVQGWLGVPVAGSVPLFLLGAALDLFACTALGIFLATFARTMPQFALLTMLVQMPLQLLSGGTTPRESMPRIVQEVMLAAPTTHFIAMAQGVLYRGAGFSVIWPNLLAMFVIGAVLFLAALRQFSRSLGGTA